MPMQEQKFKETELAAKRSVFPPNRLFQCGENCLLTSALHHCVRRREYIKFRPHPKAIRELPNGVSRNAIFARAAHAASLATVHFVFSKGREVADRDAAGVALINSHALARPLTFSGP
jgi:hypothetical protein